VAILDGNILAALPVFMIGWTEYPLSACLLHRAVFNLQQPFDKDPAEGGFP
jgi:hypothetical protein